MPYNDSRKSTEDKYVVEIPKTKPKGSEVVTPWERCPAGSYFGGVSLKYGYDGVGLFAIRLPCINDKGHEVSILNIEFRGLIDQNYTTMKRCDTNMFGTG